MARATDKKQVEQIARWSMNEVIAACIGAVVSIFLFTLSIIVNRKDKDVRSLFKRVALLEQQIAALEGAGRNKNWRNR